MKFIDCSYDYFVNNFSSNRIILFGASTGWNYYLNCFPNIENDILRNAIYVVDNGQEKHGKDFAVKDFTYKILSPEVIKKENNCIILVVVSIAYLDGICQQLCDFNLPDDVKCFSLPMMTYSNRSNDNTCVEKYFGKRNEIKIPKVIHSFWFSGDEKPELYKRCINSWHQFCPDFEIIEWNSQNYDYKKNTYMKEAYDRKKWAFVSDYARLDIISRYGGIYMDMDVELLSSIDFLLKADSFFFRQEDGFLELGSGFGAQKNDGLILKMLSTYYDRRLVMESGEIDKTPQPEWLKKVLQENGIGREYDSQIIDNRIILSNDFITCYHGENSSRKALLGIHWHNGGWLDEEDRKKIKKSFEIREKIKQEWFTSEGY